MLKYTYETSDQELKTWIDSSNGFLHIQIGGEIVSVPFETGLELVAVLKQKQSTFKEVERKKRSSWTKFLELVAGEGKLGFWGTSWSEI